MPKIIDERVVEMKFDNKQFEHNAQNSLKTLDNLKKSLNFNGAVKGLQQFEKASNGINLSGMDSAIQTIQNRFSTLGVMGDQIIRRLTDSALNMARRMGQEFTIKPMQTGFQEYETQINAVQTIMANTGAPIEKVNAALDELNAYADKTIYNFTEMTRNIGTFTAAGVDIDTSTAAIKGIANLSAVSGANAQDAARVMYQLSQAIASGTVRLRDWISVENANIGGKVFQEALKDTARLHGWAIDQMIEDEGTFRETLNQGWLTSDILLETLQKFTGELSEEQLRSMGYTEEQARKIYEMGVTANDAATKVKTFTQLFSTLAEARQSGWTQSWEIIIGDFEEAKGLLTMISDRFNEAIGDSANARNLVLQQWSDLGGRTLLIESVINVLDTLEGIVWSVKNAFHEIFPEVTAENLFNITSKIWGVTESLKNLFSFSRGSRYSIADTSVGEMLDQDKFAVLGPVLTTISKIFKGFFSLIGAGLSIMANFGKIVIGVLKMLAPLGLFILNVLGNIGDYFSALGNAIKSGIGLIDGMSSFEGFFESVNSALISLLSVFIGTTEGLETVVPNFKTLFSMIFESAKLFATGIYNTIIENDYLGKAITFIKTAILSVLMVIPMAISALASLLSKIKQYITENKLLEIATNKVKSAISNFVNQIKIGYSAIKSFISGVVKFVKEHAVLTKVFSKSISFFKSVASGIKDFWTRLVEAFKISSKIDTSNITGFFAKLKARLIPFKGLFPLIEEPIKGFKKLVIAIKETFNSIREAFSNGVSSIKEYIRNSAGSLSTAYKVIGEKLKPVADWIANNVDLGTVFRTITLASALINVSKFAKTLSGLGGVLKGAVENFGKNLNLFVENTKKLPEKEGFGNALLKIAGSIGILVGSLWLLSKIDQNKLNDGMIRLGALAVGIIAFFGVMKLLKIDKSKAILNVGDNLIKMAGAVIIMIAAIALLSGMKTETMVTGLIRIGEILLVLTGISKISGGGLSSNGKPAFVGMAVAVMLLAWTLKDLAKVKPEVMANGLIAMGLVLLELAVFTRIANGSNLSSGGKKRPAFISMAISVMILAEVLKGLGRMDPDKLKQGLIALGAILLEIGVFSRLMSGSKFDFKNTVLMLVALGGSLFLFMEAINKTANVSGAKMLAFGLSFGIVVGSLALGLKALSKISFGDAIKAMANVGIVIGLLGVGMGAIGAVFGEVEAVQKWLTSGGEILGQVGTGIGKFIQGIINPNGDPQEKSFSFERLGTELGNFVTNAEPFFAKMKDISEGELANIGALALAVSELAGAAAMTKGKAMSSVGESLGSLGKGLVDFSIQARDVDTDAVEGTKAGLEMLTDIYNRLPPRFGALQAIFGTKDLVVFGHGLTQLGFGLKHYSDQAVEVKPKAVEATIDGLTMLETIYNGLTPIGGVMSLVDGEINPFDFALGIKAIGLGLKDYSDQAVQVKPKAVEATIDGLTMLQDIYNNLTPIGGVASLVDGEINPFDFALGIEAMGRGLSDYSSNINGVNAKKVTASADALSALAKIYDDLPNIDGLIQGIIGRPSLKQMGKELPKLGEGLASFYDSLDGNTDFTNVSSAATALEDLAGVYEYIPNFDGLMQIFSGEKNLATFGTQMKTLGENMSIFVGYFTGEEYPKMTEGMKNAKGIFDSLNTLFTDNGSTDISVPPGYSNAVTRFTNILDYIILALEPYTISFAGVSSTLENFGTYIPKLATGVMDFQKNLKGKTDFKDVISAAVAINMLSTTYKNLPKFGGAGKAYQADNDDFRELSDTFNTLGENIYTFAKYFVGENYSTISTGVSNSQSIFDSLRQLFTDASGDIAVPDYSSAISNFTNLLDLVIIALEPYTISFYNVGSNLMVNLTDGVNSVSDLPVNTFVTTLNSCIRSLESYNDDFYIIGQNYGIGIANGINSRVSLAVSAANRIANAAINASKKGFNEHSPSKEGYQIGAYFTEGIANGMAAFANLTNRASDQVSSGAIHAAQTAMSMINSIIESGDVAPTIRPVLDLSNIANGTDQINSLLGQTKTLTADAINVRSFNQRAMSLQSGINQNGSIGRDSNRDVVAAINTLGSRIDTMNEEIHNLKIVLNTGVLAGELEPEINRRLGLRMAYEERGV